MRQAKSLAVLAAAGIIALSGAGTAGAATGRVAPGGAGGRPAMRPDAVVIHRVREPQRQVRAFWTTWRLRHARAARLPVPPRSGHPIAAGSTGRAVVVPGSLPRLTRRNGQASQVWASHGQMPATTVGKLYFQTSTGAAYCTAAVVSAPNQNTVWTAGHCVSDGQGDWYSDWLFQPDEHDGTAPFGSFAPAYVVTTKGFFYQSLFQYDFAAMAMPASETSLQSQVGAQGLRIGTSTFRWSNVYDFGYPADLSPPTVSVDPEKLRYCTVSTASYPALGMMSFLCNMGHGSSGGPLLWDLRLSRGWGYLVGNMSLGLTGSYRRLSPQLGSAAVSVYNAVKNR